MAKRKDLTGFRSGKLVALRMLYVQHFKCGREHEMWECLCDCGKKVVVDKGCLMRQSTKSCGCLKRELARKQMTKHGGCKTRLWYVWYSMRQRCVRKGVKGYKYYGGKGIKVCENWNDYQNFYEWAVANGWRQGLSIDRINPNKDYCPENCRWVDFRMQNNNKTNTRRFEFQGNLLTLREISDITHIPLKVIEKRIWRGWDSQSAFSTPLGTSRLKKKLS